MTSQTPTPTSTPLHAAVLGGGEGTADSSRLAQLQIVTALLSGAAHGVRRRQGRLHDRGRCSGASRAMLATLSTDRRVLDIVRDETDSGPDAGRV